MRCDQVMTYEEAVADFGRRWEASRLDDVRQYLARIRYDMRGCKWSLLPRSYCGGCYAGHHTHEPKRFG